MNDSIYSGIPIDPIKKEDVMLHCANKIFSAGTMLLRIIGQIEAKEVKKTLEELKLNPMILDNINQEMELAYATLHFDMLSKKDPDLEPIGKDLIEGYRELNYESYLSSILKVQLDPFALKRIEVAYTKLARCQEDFFAVIHSGLFDDKAKSNDVFMKLHKDQLDGTMQLKKYSEDLAKKLKEDADAGDKSKS